MEGRQCGEHRRLGSRPGDGIGQRSSCRGHHSRPLRPRPLPRQASLRAERKPTGASRSRDRHRARRDYRDNLAASGHALDTKRRLTPPECCAAGALGSPNGGHRALALPGEVAAGRAAERGLGERRRPGGGSPVRDLRCGHRVRPHRAASPGAALRLGAASRRREPRDHASRRHGRRRRRGTLRVARPAGQSFVRRRPAVHAATRTSTSSSGSRRAPGRRSRAPKAGSTTARAPACHWCRPATIGAWDARRFRSNLVLDGEGEDALVGTTVTVGERRSR